MNSELGRESIEIYNGDIACKDPPRFEFLFMQAKQAHFDGERAQLQQEASLDDGDSVGAERRSMKRTSKLGALNRMSALWTTRAPRLALSGVLITEDMLHRFGFSGLSRTNEDDNPPPKFENRSKSGPISSLGSILT